MPEDAWCARMYLYMAIAELLAPRVGLGENEFHLFRLPGISRHLLQEENHALEVHGLQLLGKMQ